MKASNQQCFGRNRSCVVKDTENQRRYQAENKYHTNKHRRHMDFLTWHVTSSLFVTCKLRPFKQFAFAGQPCNGVGAACPPPPVAAKCQIATASPRRA